MLPSGSVACSNKLRQLKLIIVCGLLMLVTHVPPRHCTTTTPDAGNETMSPAMTTSVRAATTDILSTETVQSTPVGPGDVSPTYYGFTANITGFTQCYVHSSWNTTCFSYSGVCYVKYDVQRDAVTYGCTQHSVAMTAMPDDNVTVYAVASGNCVDDRHGFYAHGVCEYCCLSNLCNRDMTSSWIKTDCSRLRSSAATVTVATAAVAMATATSLRQIMTAV